MPGMFDDLIPSGSPAPAGGGMFDDLIPKEEQPSVAGDMAKSAGIGVVKGGINLAGIPGEISRGMNWLGDQTQRKLTDWGLMSPEESQRQQERFQKDFQPERGNPIPGPEEIRGGLEKATGPLYEPKTWQGQVAQTAGEFLPNVIGGPGTIAGKLATRVVAPALASEGAGYLTKGTEYEPWARVGAALATQGPQAVRDIKSLVTKPEINAPSLEELHDAASQAYKTARGFGVEIKRAPVSRLADDILSDLHNDGFRKLDAPSAWNKIEELKNPAGKYVTIDDLESVRKALGKANPMNGVEKEVGRRGIEAIDKYVSSLDRNAGHIAVNPHFASDVASSIKKARGNWGAMKRGETIEGKLDAANQQTGRAGSGANINNATRQQISQVLRSPKLRRGFSGEELAAMRQIVMGTKAGNLARKVGKLSPEGIVSGGLGIELGHLATGNLAHGLVVPMLGKIAKIFGDRSTAKQAERLSQMVRARSPLGQTLPQPGRPPVSVSPYVGTGLLGQSSAQEHEGHAAGGRADGGPTDDDNLSPQDQALASSMTHQAEGPNPAAPYIQGTKDFLSGGLQKAFGLPENALSRALQSDAANTALGVMTPMKGAAALEGAVATKPSITAYHGSPHDFDRFDISKIGTGEGAQAYGHGLYFAENEGVAKQYRDQLAPPPDLTSVQDLADQYLTATGSRNAAIKELQKGAKANAGTDYGRDHEQAIDLIKSGWTSPTQSPGRMYQVAINADPEHFLDFDKRVAEQSPEVKERLRKAGLDPEATKHMALQNALDTLGDPNKPGYGQADISEKLRAAGIPGIKYLDQGSRFQPQQVEHLKNQVVQLEDMLAKNPGRQDIAKALEGRRAELAEMENSQTRNYVVFSHDIIDILKKYGLAGLVASGAYHYQDKANAQGRASGGRVIGAHGQSEVGLAQNEPGVSFRCGTCEFFKKGVCHNENPALKGRKVKPHWCCALYNRAGMKKIA